MQGEQDAKGRFAYTKRQENKRRQATQKVKQPFANTSLPTGNSEKSANGALPIYYDSKAKIVGKQRRIKNGFYRYAKTITADIVGKDNIQTAVCQNTMIRKAELFASTKCKRRRQSNCNTSPWTQKPPQKGAKKRTACAVLLRFIVVILTLRQATSSSITVKVMTEASELRFVTGLNFTTETEPLPRLNTYSPSTSGTDQPVALVERL